jgi:hypothetical protein
MPTNDKVMDVFSAKDARSVSEKVLNSETTEEFNMIMTYIKEAAEKGKCNISVGHITAFTTCKLHDLGYTITVVRQYNEVTTTISWEYA